MTNGKNKLILAAGIAAVLVAGLLLAASLSWRHLMQAEPAGAVPGQSDPDSVPTGERPTTLVKDRVLVLVLGVDEREDDNGRSDTVMVASMDPEHNTLGLVSIPRDTWVEIPGHGRDKLNHAYAYGGYKLSMQTVEKLLDLPMEHYVIIDFKGFEKVIDAVGGIEIEVEKKMHYVDPYQNLKIDLNPGLQVLDGKHALQYARFRHDAQGDYGRLERQHKVIKALIDKATSPSSALKVPSLVNALFGAVRTDLSLSQALDFALTAREMAKGTPLQTAVLKGDDQMLNQVYYMVPDIESFRTEAYKVLLGEDPPADYLSRARAAQEEVKAARDAAVAKERARQAEKAAAGGDENNGTEQTPSEDGTTPGTDPAQPEGTTDPSQPDSPEEEDNQSGASAAEPAEAKTVAIVDASGKNLLGKYVLALNEMGFQVVTVSRAKETSDRTVVEDGSGDANVTLALQSLFSYARWETRAGGGEPAIAIRLGRDAN